VIAILVIDFVVVVTMVIVIVIGFGFGFGFGFVLVLVVLVVVLVVAVARVVDVRIENVLRILVGVCFVVQLLVNFFINAKVKHSFNKGMLWRNFRETTATRQKEREKQTHTSF
jgi:hypothetical protein